MLTFDRLHTFTVAAEEMNFTRAARRLGLSQPAISLQIKELEEHLQVSLFERKGRRLLLTPAGERLRPRAHAILRSVDAACNELAEFRSVYQGVLHIGASTTLGIYLLPYALGAFSKAFPGIRASLKVKEIDDIVQDVNENALDLALVEEDLSPGRIHGWEKVPFMQDELSLIVAPEHPWARRRQVTLAELDRESFIMRPGPSAVRQFIHDRLSAARFDPKRLNIRFELNHTEGIKRAVMADLGAAFVSRCAITMELEAGRLAEIAIAGLDLRRTLWLLRPTQEKRSANQQRFCDVVLGGEWIPATMKALTQA